MVFLCFILNVGILIRTIRAEWSVLEVVLVGVGPGGPPAHDTRGHGEPPPHTDQTHSEADGRRTKEMLEYGLANLEDTEDSAEQQCQS